MREFVDLNRESELKKFLDSQLGTLYIIRDASGVPRLMVRHFDRGLLPTLVKPFAELIEAVYMWIEAYPELARLIRVERPVEVGFDFIARPFHIYYGSLRAYTDWEDPPEPPEELELMRNAFRAAIGKSTEGRDAVIEAVLARSLLEPTSKTYFDESKRQFFVVEPKLTSEDVELWATQLDRLK
jgi:hypothetical protein